MDDVELVEILHRLDHLPCVNRRLSLAEPALALQH